MDKRLNRESYFMHLARLTAKRSTCNRAQVGCVLVDTDSNRIAAVGYNSAHKGNVHCEDKGCLIEDGHCIRCPHAEIAALSNLERKYNNLTCYLTHQPCLNCFKALVSFGVTTIYYDSEYVDDARNMLSKELSNIKMEQWFD
jgi:dCMP deaminase